MAAARAAKAAVKPVRQLTPKQEKFCAEYMIDGNATEAYRRAGYPGKGAEVSGCQLLKNPKVEARLAELKAAYTERTFITRDRILQELARIAFFDPRKMYRPDGSMKLLSEMDDDTAACIAGLDVEELYEGRGEDRTDIGRIKKVKLVDKVAALTLAMRHLGMLQDKMELTGKDGEALKLSAPVIQIALPTAIMRPRLDARRIDATEIPPTLPLPTPNPKDTK